MKILGFDVSSTVTAYCVMEVDNKKITSITHGFFKPKKTGTIFERLNDLILNITKIVQEHNPDYVAIEDIAKFMAGKSTANTIIMLALFNRQVGLTCFNLGKKPELYNVLQIRHCIKLTKACPKKEEVPSILEQRLNIKFPYVMKNNKIKQESYDIADAYAVALTFIIKNKLI